MRVIEWCLGRVDELVIVVGSAQESHTLRNPFTAGERLEMLALALREAGIDPSRVFTVPLADIAMNYVWPRYVEQYTPRFQVVFTRNPLVARLFAEYGYSVEEPPAFDRLRLSATRIRGMMLRGSEEWRGLVPGSVASYIDEIGGVERLRMLARSDEG